ncbi:hypothetical protein BC940DRAFT_288313 [Gongronella butleri]|nr:hypothetical protein BC940DRAFT_288313 [Gongronella butleri]
MRWDAAHVLVIGLVVAVVNVEGFHMVNSLDARVKLAWKVMDAEAFFANVEAVPEHDFIKVEVAERLNALVNGHSV